jgi:hypothetical protein
MFTCYSRFACFSPSIVAAAMLAKDLWRPRMAGSTISHRADRGQDRADRGDVNFCHAWTFCERNS